MDENDKELDKALKKRLKELEEEQSLLSIVRKYLTPKAYERLMNVKLANYELYKTVLNILVANIQANRLNRMLSEDELKEILLKLSSRPEPKIEFKHK